MIFKQFVIVELVILYYLSAGMTLTDFCVSNIYMYIWFCLKINDEFDIPVQM